MQQVHCVVQDNDMMMLMMRCLQTAMFAGKLDSQVISPSFPSPMVNYSVGLVSLQSDVACILWCVAR